MAPIISFRCRGIHRIPHSIYQAFRASYPADSAWTRNSQLLRGIFAEDANSKVGLSRVGEETKSFMIACITMSSQILSFPLTTGRALGDVTGQRRSPREFNGTSHPYLSIRLLHRPRPAGAGFPSGEMPAARGDDAGASTLALHHIDICKIKILNVKDIHRRSITEPSTRVPLMVNGCPGSAEQTEIVRYTPRAARAQRPPISNPPALPPDARTGQLPWPTDRPVRRWHLVMPPQFVGGEDQDHRGQYAAMRRDTWLF